MNVLYDADRELVMLRRSLEDRLDSHENFNNLCA